MTSPQSFPGNAQPQPQSSGSDMGAYAASMGVHQGSGITDNPIALKKKQIAQVGMQLRQLSQSLDGVAKQFPEASREIQALQSGFTAVMVKIVGSSSSESQPPTGALG